MEHHMSTCLLWLAIVFCVSPGFVSGFGSLLTFAAQWPWEFCKAETTMPSYGHLPCTVYWKMAFVEHKYASKTVLG